MTDAELLTALAPEAERLLGRHLDTAKEWFPHELVPWDRGVDLSPGSDAAEGMELPAGVGSALVVNLLTEDNLPFYVLGLHERLGSDGPWGAWVRRWTAEEMRHATVIRDYLVVTRAVDLIALERARLQHVSTSPTPSTPTAVEALVYVTLQELATRVAHGNTGRALKDPAGEAIMKRVAADENLHYLFYRDLVSAALELDPSGTVLAIGAQTRHFVMPGTAMSGFAEHSVAIADAGIYSATMLHDQVLVPVLLSHWRLDHLEGLSAEADKARDRTIRFLDRLSRLAARLPGATGAVPAGAPAPRGSS